MIRQLDGIGPPSNLCSRTRLNPARSPDVTPELAAKIKRHLMENMAQHDITATFKINQGRVSEIKTGKKFGDTAPAAGA